MNVWRQWAAVFRVPASHGAETASLGRTAALTTFAMLAFAGNSVLCRLALTQTTIDPGTFTLVRLVSGGLCLWLLSLVTGRERQISGSWKGALALLAYAAAFSFAYVSLPAGAGALLLFGAVQATMIIAGLWRGERLSLWQWGGLVLAVAGLVVLVAPGVSAPEPLGALLMAGAGTAWGLYSLLGRGVRDPMAATSGNFIRAATVAAVLALPLAAYMHADSPGLAYAVLSGALASGLGYIVWYAALPGLSATKAASVQLSVPVITAIMAVLVLGEHLSARLVLASLAILGGIALVIAGRR